MNYLTRQKANQIESLGILLMGIGVFAGSIATTQWLFEAAILSVFIIAIEIVVALVGRNIRSFQRTSVSR